MGVQKVNLLEGHMQSADTILIFDRDAKRRAQICYLLRNAANHVEPYSDPTEPYLRFPPSGKILAYDDGHAISDVQATLRQHAAWLPIIAYSASPQPELVVSALDAGAIDYLSWPFEFGRLSAHLERLDARLPAIQRLRARGVSARKKLKTLSQRERQVLDYMSEGITSRAIAGELGISPRTVDIHRANAIRKLGASGTVDAVRIAISDSEAGSPGPNEIDQRPKAGMT